MITENEVRVLIVEDEDDIRFTLIEVLELEGFKVDSACSGNSGFALASVNKYACIISDIGMSDGTGLDMVNKLRSHQIQTPIFFFTAFSEYSEKEILKAGNTKIYEKRGGIDDLISVVKKYLPP